MQTFTYVITDEAGLHARPAGTLAKAAKAYSSKVMINCNGKSAEATKLMALLSLGIKKGTEITVTVEGSDEETAAVELKDMFTNNL